MGVPIGDSELTGRPVLQDDVCFAPSTQQKFDLLNKLPLLYKKRLLRGMFLVFFALLNNFRIASIDRQEQSITTIAIVFIYHSSTIDRHYRSMAFFCYNTTI
ncbi:hypothetical protein H0O35_16600 [Escherichia coli]|nr:hypothetical protein [Escherichia coli]